MSSVRRCVAVPLGVSGVDVEGRAVVDLEALALGADVRAVLEAAELRVVAVDEVEPDVRAQREPVLRATVRRRRSR